MILSLWISALTGLAWLSSTRKLPWTRWDALATVMAIGCAAGAMLAPHLR